MDQESYRQLRIGILGGGQLGRMLIQSGMDWNILFSVLDPDSSAPCKSVCDFRTGKLTDYNTVLDFGESCDLVTIEIENVNVEALKKLSQRGKKIFPQPEVIALIQDKSAQKKFYKENNIPTADFLLVENRQAIIDQKSFLPAVNKLNREGYDGRGVQIVRTEKDIDKAFDAPGLLEKFVDFDKEISVIVARNENGDVQSFPAVEMVFHPEANLVEYLFSRAQLTETVANEADRIAKLIISDLKMVGLLAVEMFVTKEQKVLVNEIAPRPHNSGHQTIEANITSQYQQHLRAILNLPLGDTSVIHQSAMVNLLGEEGFSGEAKYQLTNGRKILKIPGVYVHLYGKRKTHQTVSQDGPRDNC